MDYLNSLFDLLPTTITPPDAYVGPPMYIPVVIQDDVRGVVFLIGEASTEDVPDSDCAGRVAPAGDVVPG